MRLFQSSGILQTADVGTMAAYQSAVAPTRFYTAPEAPVRAWVSQVERLQVRCMFADVSGPLVRVALNSGDDAPIGIVLEGRVQVVTHDQSFMVGPGEAVWSFPGDFVTLASRRMVVAAIRTPIGDEGLFRLRALPYRSRQRLLRHATATEAVHLYRLLEFFSEECERVGKDGSGAAKTHLDGLARCLSDLLHRMIPLSDDLRVPADPEALRVCLAVDALLRKDPLGTVLTSVLADHAACSVRQLYRAFERVLGISPHAYAKRARLLAARNRIMLDPIGGALEGERHRGDARFRSAYCSEFGESPVQTRRRCSLLVEGALDAVFGRRDGLTTAP